MRVIHQGNTEFALPFALHFGSLCVSLSVELLRWTDLSMFKCVQFWLGVLQALTTCENVSSYTECLGLDFRRIPYLHWVLGLMILNQQSPEFKQPREVCAWNNSAVPVPAQHDFTRLYKGQFLHSYKRTKSVKPHLPYICPVYYHCSQKRNYSARQPV